MLTGKDLIALGYEPGKWFREALDKLNAYGVTEPEKIQSFCDPLVPRKVALQDELKVQVFADDLDENLQKCIESMQLLSRTPTIREVQVMPDACPAGPSGSITVGGVAKAELAIHPGMHSADVCCSLMLTEFRDVDPKTVLDEFHKLTHFGGGPRQDGRFHLPWWFTTRAMKNPFTNDEATLDAFQDYLGSQGDGNHFAFVGTSERTGRTVLVTHHGSRGPGASVYKKGLRLAEKLTKLIAPEVPRYNAWIPFESQEGLDYWAALHLIRRWTKLNHEVLHNELVKKFAMEDRFWNEHNFVFRDGDYFWHAKGATPVKPDLMYDSTGEMIIPMNLAEPVLIVSQGATDFAPHGAGRNYSRTQHYKLLGEHSEEEILRREVGELDFRFFNGVADLSELPSAYKSAAQVQKEIEAHNLAVIEDRILPYGGIMAGRQVWEGKRK